jgi:hypothetical protein
MRNLLSRVPKSAQPMVATLVRSVFEQPGAASVRDQHAASWPSWRSASRSLRASLDEARRWHLGRRAARARRLRPVRDATPSRCRTEHRSSCSPCIRRAHGVRQPAVARAGRGVVARRRLPAAHGRPSAGRCASSTGCSPAGTHPAEHRCDHARRRAPPVPGHAPCSGGASPDARVPRPCTRRLSDTAAADVSTTSRSPSHRRWFASALPDANRVQTRAARRRLQRARTAWERCAARQHHEHPAAADGWRSCARMPRRRDRRAVVACAMQNRRTAPDGAPACPAGWQPSPRR